MITKRITLTKCDGDAGTTLTISIMETVTTRTMLKEEIPRYRGF